MIDFLIGVALLVDLELPPGQGNHRRASEKSILQPGGEIDRPHGLGHAKAGTTLDPSIGVSHVGSRLLAWVWMR